MSTVIEIKNLYKEYRLGVIGHGTLSRDMQSWWAKVRGKPDPNSLLSIADPHKDKDSILALNNINLEVKDSEILGIIGANGAGKSTLLKILSNITAPTGGTIKYKGKVASLLEVGTGFHSELTGRENIYLNGAINGMNRIDIKKKLDEIVDFSGVEEFIDTPVKRYSSGMYVRLGFAVAAHMDPNILVVDEVLAVGDASFQNKAIGKMQDISKSKGRTVLFVSHNMNSIRKLCKRVILLEEGEIKLDGKSDDVISEYLNPSLNRTNKSGYDSFRESLTKISGKVQITNIQLFNKDRNITGIFFDGETAIIELAIKVFKPINELFLVLIIQTDLKSLGGDGEFFYSKHIITNRGLDKNFEGKINIELNTSELNAGRYPLEFWMCGKRYKDWYDILRDPVVIRIERSDPDGFYDDFMLRLNSDIFVKKVSLL